MKATQAISNSKKRVFRSSGDGANGNKTEAAKSPPRRIYRQPKTEAEQAIQRYVDLFEFAPIGFVTFDRAGRIEDINFVAVHLLGRFRRQLIGTPFALCIAKGDRQLFLHHLLKCRSAGGPVVTELKLRRTDGEKIPVQLSSTVTFALMKDGARLYQTAIFDLSERRATETALRESEERLRAFVWQANAGMARYDLKGRIKFVNSRFCKILGYTDSELIGKAVREITHPDDVEKTMHAFENVTRRGEPTEFDKRYICKDGAIVWVNVCDAPERDAEGRSKSVVAVAIDITARKEAETALQKLNELLEKHVRERTHELYVANKELKSEIERRKGLEGEILAVSDREQQRLGQELHDGLCQHLTAVAFMARSVALRLKNHRVIDAADIEKIAELVNSAASDTRELSRALHRADVDAAGLVDALQDLVDREIWRTPCTLLVRPSFHIEDNAAAAHLFRVAREAVINANKHAEARKIVVKLERSQDGMVLRVMDDGIGFPSESKLKQGLGYHIMNYRAQLMGGRLKIELPKKGGTCVSCYFPDSAHESHKPDATKSNKLPRLSEKLTKTLAALI